MKLSMLMLSHYSYGKTLSTFWLWCGVCALLVCSVQLAIGQTGLFGESYDDCTIGVAAGRVTSDGRPLLWKTRDATAPHNIVRYDTERQYSFIAVLTAGGTAPWMAVNEKGFALVNANSLDLPGRGNSENGSFMRDALGMCATVAAFQRLLDSTNTAGRLTQAHFAVIDSTGAAALFETGADRYWKYDATDSGQTPEGYIVRTNFAFNGGGNVGLERYRRSCSIVQGLQALSLLDYKGVIRNQMRDFSNPAGDPFAVPFPQKLYVHMPFGYVCTSVSICRAASVSAAVIHGVLPGELAPLTTMWTMLGQPATSIALPFWPVGETPHQVDGDSSAPLCNEANRIKSHVFEYAIDPISRRSLDYIDTYKLQDGLGSGLWTLTLPVEEEVFSLAERSLSQWRVRFPDVHDILDAEEFFAQSAFAVLQNVRFDSHGGVGTTPKSFVVKQNYPNPFNSNTIIQYELPRATHVTVILADVLGREVAHMVDGEKEEGQHQVTFDADGLPSGIYFYRFYAGGISVTKKMLLVK